MKTNIIKETYKGFQAVNIHDEFYSRRVIFFTAPVEPLSAETLISQLLWLEYDAPGEPITLCINSPGGDVHSGLAVCDVIKNMSSPVTTVCVGMAASMGAIIFLQGKERIMLPHSKLLIHDPSFGRGSLTDKKPLALKEDLDNLMAMRQELAEIISERTGHSLETILAKTKDDCYMTAKEALEFGAATEIGSLLLKDRKEVFDNE